MSLVTIPGWQDSSIVSPEKPKLIITTDLMDQIKHMCQNTPVGEEWSGPLIFNEKEGDISKPEELVLEGVFLYPLNIGNSVFTSYEMLPRPGSTQGSPFMKWAIQNVFKKGLRIGHIHSHHRMPVFFSHTDQKELIENSDKYQYYLSLIVNNKSEMVARIGITYKATIDVEAPLVKKLRAKHFLTKTFSYKKEVSQTYYFDVEIIKPEVSVLPEWYLQAFDKLVKKPKPQASLPMGQIGLFTNVTGIAEELICMTLVPDQKLGRVADAIKFLIKEKEESAYESADAFLEHQEFLIKANFQDAVDFVLDKEDNLKDVLKECLDILGDLKRNKLTAFLFNVFKELYNTYADESISQ